MNNIIIQKFGGSILSGVHDLPKIAQYIINEINNSNFPVVVVSAFFGHTNKLLQEASAVRKLASPNQTSISPSQQNHSQEINTLSKNYINSEIDVCTSTGESLSSGLISLYLNELGYKSQSLLGWQIPIITDNNYQNANISKVKKDLLEELISNNIIPIIAGFQGISYESPICHRITTLGRGGTDVTAMIIAGALSAKRVDIYKDVEIMSGDPNVIKNPKSIQTISAEMMYHMSNGGVKAVNPRASAIGIKYSIPIRVIACTIDSNFINDSMKTEVIKQFPNINEMPEFLNISIQNNFLVHVEATSSNFEKIAIVNKLLDILPIKIMRTYLVYKYSNEEIINKIQTIYSIDRVNIVTITGYNLDNAKNILLILQQVSKVQSIEIISIEMCSIKIEILIKGRDSQGFIMSLHKIFIENALDSDANMA